MNTSSIQRFLTTRKFFVLATVLLTGGCATTQAPSDGSSANDGLQPPTVESVRIQPELHQNRTVRWGGTVVAVENRDDSTWVEVIERPLSRGGQPLTTRQSRGRFMAVVPGFLDPVDYSAGKAITITGAVDGSDTRKIGEASYDYPRVVVSEHQLWTAEQTRFARRGRGGYGYKGHYGLSYYSPFIGFSYGSRFGSRLSLSFGHPFRYGYIGHRYRSGYGFRNHPFGHGRYFYRGGRQHLGRFRTGSRRAVSRRF